MKFANHSLKGIVLITSILFASNLMAQSKEVNKINQQRYYQIIKENGNKTVAHKKDYINQRALAYSFAQSELNDKAFDAYSELLDKYSSQADAFDKLNFALVARKLELYGLSDSMILTLKSNSEYAGKPLFEELNDQFYAENKDKRADYWQEYDFNSNYSLKQFPAASSAAEYGIIIDDKENCYYTTHEEKGLRKVLSAWFEQPYYSIFKAKYNDSTYNSAVELSNTKRSLHQHISFYDAKTGFMYVTRNAEKSNKNKEKVLQIFAMKQNIFTKKWKEVPFQLNNSEFSVADLVISPDGTKVIFVSDMVGGFGKSDLYEAPIISNDDNGLKIGEAVNMGPKVNTVLRDNFPRFSDSGDLYFSSEGHLGFGGLDVFTLDKNSGMVINLGKPVNSNLDDFAALFHDKWGTLSSNRTNNGSAAPKYNDNLYFFRWTEDKDSTEPTVNEVLVSVYDKDSKSPIPQASIALDNLDDQDKAIQATTDTEGKFLFAGISKNAKVQLASHPCGYRYASSSKFSVNEKGQKTLDLFIEKYKVGDELGELFDVKPIYYESNKFTLSQSSKKELDRVAIVLQDNKGLSVELGSHTDSKGSDETNLVLSKNRAQAVYDYLVMRGVSKSRLTFQGFGEKKLKNRCKNGVNCSETEHQKNRRTEYRVSSIIPCGEIKVEENPVLTSDSADQIADNSTTKPDNKDNTAKNESSNTSENEDGNDNGNLNAGPIACGDADGDKIPDYLDQDSDNDGIPDAAEGHGDADKDGLPNCVDKDSDNDGIADAVEKSVDFDKDGKTNMVDKDSDNDGINDEDEGVKDFDKDGNPNYLDFDSDDDGISDKIEKNGDLDKDGNPNYLDQDSDNDGISDKQEGNKDTDKDGKPNFLDKDSDNDDIPDSVEGTKDSDNDGKPDYLDTDSDEDGISDKVEAPVCLSNEGKSTQFVNPASKPSVKKKEPVYVEQATENQEVVNDNVGNGAIEYRVQFLMSKNKISAKTFADKGLSNVFEYRDGGYYKYTTSNGYPTENEAQIQKDKIRNLGYVDAFVVTFQNGRRVK
jgi:outer membrane protein OmpA-like peptidoglycan-associated protein